MRKSISSVVALVVVLMSFQSAVLGHDDPAAAKGAAKKSGVKLETLMKAVLEGVDSTEVIVSRVMLPPNTSLPKHWHPGEEFAYVLEGSATLWQEGKEDLVCNAGDVVKVPLKQVHTAITTDVGATFLVFRVHEQGQPERVPVDDK